MFLSMKIVILLVFSVGPSAVVADGDDVSSLVVVADSSAVVANGAFTVAVGTSAVVADSGDVDPIDVVVGTLIVVANGTSTGVGSASAVFANSGAVDRLVVVVGKFTIVVVVGAVLVVAGAKIDSEHVMSAA